MRSIFLFCAPRTRRHTTGKNVGTQPAISGGIIFSALLAACFWRSICLLGILLFLSACAGGPLLSDVQADSDTLHPSGAGETLDISYRIGRDALVSVWIEDTDGQQYILRQDEPRSMMDQPYQLPFDGTVTVGDDPVVQRRLLPSGRYTVVVQAHETANPRNRTESRMEIALVDSDVPMPAIENLVVSPQTISPNADAIDDVTEITYTLPATATVDIDITGPEGQSIAFITRQEEGPMLQQHVWDGKRPDDAPLPSGVYTYTVRARDLYGNVVQRQGQIILESVGQPEATILDARIVPERLMLGGTLTVTMRVKNTGNVPIRTYGPPDGYTYTTDDVFSSVENGRYAARAGGFWRIGLDWDANSGGGAKRYPFRWALSERPPEQWAVPGEEDWLLPGEEVEIVGQVVILQRETKMSFYVGLIQDGVGFRQDRTGRTIVEVGF